METNSIDNVKTCIVRMYESSGNVQFFVRSVRTDTREILEYNCFQTKYGRTEEQCVKDALFASIFLLKFFGHTNVDFIGFTEENRKTVELNKRFRRFVCIQ